MLLAPCAVHPVHAEPFLPGQSFNQSLMRDVTGSALAFMAPRILEPVPVWKLTLWGLRGLTTLDPRLVPELTSGVPRSGPTRPGAIQPGTSQTATPRDDAAQAMTPDTGILRLTMAGRVLATLPAPAPADAPAWGDAAAALARAAWDASEPVRHAGTQGIVSSFFDELFNHLDSYSRYTPPGEADDDEARRTGRGGVGLVPAMRGGGFVVQEVVPDGPAARAGIRPQDSILAIDGEPTQDADLASVKALLTGPEETQVTLTVRGRDRRTRDIDLTRVLIAPRTVVAQRIGDILLVQVSGFSRDTSVQIGQAIGHAVSAGRPPRGVAIDLRGNRGGLLRQAVAAADVFLTSGIVATAQGRDPDASHEFRANGTDLTAGRPVVVVVDGRSASAAEILAAALADQHRAVVVGSATLGKGLVQTIAPLPDGGELLITWSRVLAPLGWPIQSLGVLPQVCTSLGQDRLTLQLAELAQGRQPMTRALSRHRGARPDTPVAEMLEIRNACPAAEGRDADLTTARYLIDNPTAYDAALLGPPAGSPP